MELPDWRTERVGTLRVESGAVSAGSAGWERWWLQAPGSCLGRERASLPSGGGGGGTSHH